MLLRSNIFQLGIHGLWDGPYNNILFYLLSLRRIIKTTLLGKGESMDFKKLAVFGSAVLFGISLTACGDDSSSGPTGDEGKKKEAKGDDESLLPDVSGEGCNFKKDDKVWSYVIKSSYEGLDNETYRYYIYNEKGSKDSTITVTKGSQVGMACAYLGGDEEVLDDDEESKRTQKVECKDNAMWTIDVTQMKYEDESRDEAFETIMDHCKAINNYSKEDLQDALDSLKNSSGGGNDEDGDEDEDEDGDEVESSSSESDDSDVESSSSQVTEPKDDSSSSVSAEIECDFSKDDNVWNISMGGVSDMTIEWTDEGPVAVTKTDMQMAELCDIMASSMEEDGVEASCEGAILMMRDPNQYAGATKDELYESFSAVCAE
jgi:hypothetical protein